MAINAFRPIFMRGMKPIFVNIIHYMAIGANFGVAARKGNRIGNIRKNAQGNHGGENGKSGKIFGHHGVLKNA